ncbi:unnamed protein product [Danaus chrysippus]|uniref:(African queen) hypothetical protein n=1 Tax=Danaus chrysippus TaxID=151541 RepID=A0A8J2QBY1_9NEOP|nr:unnamed protein product [Danaus chrysippus]
MAPPPEYDKEPKAPDKSVTTLSTDDPKILYNHLKDQPANTDSKTSTTTGGAITEVETVCRVNVMEFGSHPLMRESRPEQAYGLVRRQNIMASNQKHAL